MIVVKAEIAEECSGDGRRWPEISKELRCIMVMGGSGFSDVLELWVKRMMEMGTVVFARRGVRQGDTTMGREA